MKLHTLSITTAALCVAMPAMAVTTTWNADTVGDYDDGVNWDNWIPTSIDEAIIGSGEATRSGDLGRAAETTVNGTGTLVVNGRLLNAQNGAATFNVGGTGAVNQAGNYFIIAQNNTGVFNQTGGSVTANIDRGFFLSDHGGSQGTYNLSGGSLNVTYTAYEGTDFHSQFLGRGGNDLFHVNGGAATFTSTNSDNRRIYLLRDSELRIDSGSITFNDFRYFVIGREGTGNARVTINGGVFNANMIGGISGFIVGGGGEAATLEINGGQLNITDNEFWIGDGGAKGVVNQTAGDVFVDGFNVVIGRSGDINADEYNMSGGTLAALGIIQGGDDTSIFNFSGGLITLTGDQTSLLNEDWFVASNGAFANYDSLNDLTTIAVPEPGSLVLLALGGLLGIRRCRRA